MGKSGNWMDREIAARRAARSNVAGGALLPGWEWWYQDQPGYGAPSERQLQFLASAAPILLYGGAKGGGKTQAGLWKLTRYAMKYPRIRMVAGRQFWTHTSEYLLADAEEYWNELRKHVGIAVDITRPAGKSWAQARFTNGSIVRFIGFDDPKSFQGAGWNIAWVDEASHIDEDSHKEIEGRMRGKSFGPDDPRRGYPVQRIYTTNFATGWLHDRIAMPAKAGRPQDQMQHSEFVESSVYDLRVKYKAEAEARGAPEADYITTMLSSGMHSEEELRGYAAPTGTVWPQLNESRGSVWDRHVITISEFHEHFYGVKVDDTAYGGFDHGNSEPSCLLGAVVRKDPMGRNIAVIYREWYQPLGDRPNAVIAHAWREIAGPAHLERGWWDCHMKPRIGKGTSPAILAAEGTVDPRTHLRNAGMTRWHDAHSSKPGFLDAGIRLVGTLIAAGLVKIVGENCPNFLREYRGYMKAGAGARPGKDPSMPLENCGNDHALDPARYLLCGLVSIRVLVVPDGSWIPGEIPVANVGMKPEMVDSEPGSGDSVVREKRRHSLGTYRRAPTQLEARYGIGPQGHQKRTWRP